jgi:hypothetical protein
MTWRAPSISPYLWDLVQKIEAVLFDICGAFEPTRYLPLFEAYLLLGDEVKPLGRNDG